MTPQIDALLAGAPDLAARFAARAAAHDRDASFPTENIADLRAAGWPALTVPAEYGGMGAGLSDTVRAVEQLAMGDGSTALAFTMHLQTLGSAAESRAWPAAQFEAVCRAAVAGGALVNACASEPELGSPSRGGLPRTVAVPAAAPAPGWLITGRKSFASMAPVLDYFIIPAAIQGNAGVTGIEGNAGIEGSAGIEDRDDAIGRFLVPRSAGVQVEPNWDPMGMRATGSHDLELDGVWVAEDALLYRQSAAAPDPSRAVVNAWFTLTVTAVYLGVGAAAMAAAVDYAHRRIPTGLGRPIATLEAVERQVGQMELGLRAARRVLYGVAADWDGSGGSDAPDASGRSGGSDGTDASGRSGGSIATAGSPERRAELAFDIVAAKVFVTNAALEVTDRAMRVVGGAAMRRDLPLERYFRDVRGGLYHPPSGEEALRLLGRLGLERGKPKS